MTIYDYAVEGLNYYILMDFINGPTLDVLYKFKIKNACTDEERLEVKKIAWKILKQGSEALKILAEREI